jgi:hypothetical protein
LAHGLAEQADKAGGIGWTEAPNEHHHFSFPAGGQGPARQRMITDESGGGCALRSLRGPLSRLRAGEQTVGRGCIGVRVL